MKLSRMISVIVVLLWMVTITLPHCWAVVFQDPVGDTTITDITGLEYQVNGNALEIWLTFIRIQPDTFVTINIDIDKSLITGFAGGCGYQQPSSFGVDYIVGIETGSLPISDKAYLTYERFTSHPDDPIIVARQFSIPLGNPLQPNGSNFRQSANQIYLKIPLQLFPDDLFPIYTPNTKTCVKELFPRPPDLVPNPTHAYVNVKTKSLYYFGQYDQLPDQGMVDTETGQVANCYPMGEDDLANVLSDSPNDSIQSGILGDEITALRTYIHDDGNITLAFDLTELEAHDDSFYVLNLDLDDDPSTGLLVSNGSVTLGADITAQFQNWGLLTPIGKCTPLHGELGFGSDLFCSSQYRHLGCSQQGSPGHIWITIPKELMLPSLSSNRSGVIKVIGSTRSPGFSHDSRDVVPNNGCLEIDVVRDDSDGDGGDSADTDDSSDGGGSGCFIAIAAFGS